MLKWFSSEYKDESLFRGLKIRHPDNLREIIRLLDDLQLTDINADVKGDAFEYFIRSYSASNPSDLGEIFTPRHIVKTLVKLVNPQIGETIYDPFCGTGGMLIVAFKHIMANMAHTEVNQKRLRESTLYGRELTRTASIAKMNMILAGDGHNNIERLDSLANPVDDKFDLVITNYPFAQKTRYGEKYSVPSRNGDLVCPQHCFRSLKRGGRMAIIAPDGFLSNKNDRSFGSVRRLLLENSTLKSVISLPRGAFEPYNRTKASILYLTDVRISKTKDHYWFFNVQNDGYTLDRKRRKVEGINDLELVLSEKELDIQPQDYATKIGVSKIEIGEVANNQYVLTAGPYIRMNESFAPGTTELTFGDLLEISGKDRVGNLDLPIMSITMNDGLIDQGDKFRKRIASSDIAHYKKAYRNELVVGFPIDEGVLGFQTKYDAAAVSPAYKIWKLRRSKTNMTFLELLLRSLKMREVYKQLMQGAVDRRRSIPDDIFLTIKVPLPNRQAQKRIIAIHRAMEKKKSQIKGLARNIQEEISTLWE